MKKILSLVTAFAIILQLSVVSAFAAPATDKTLFKSTSEIVGIYDCSYTALSILDVQPKGMYSYVRDLGDTEFYNTSDFTLSLLNYQLSNDKKSVTANFVTYVYGIQYTGKYVFKKDVNGNIYFNAVDYQGKNRNIYKSYDDIDGMFEVVESSAFNRTILSENAVLKKITTANTQLEKRMAAFDDSRPISAENHLHGYYMNGDESQYIKFSFNYDYNVKDYSNFFTYTRVHFSIDTKTYTIDAKNTIIKNGVATYLQDAKNYMEISTANRETVTNVKVVQNGKVVINQKVNLSLSK